ncbi:hypothetical protein ACEQ8H_000559 [Pleosporales sp. CAS-2024a]
MSQHNPRYEDLDGSTGDVWFSMPNSAGARERHRAPEQSIYRATTHSLGTGFTSSAVTRSSSKVPRISTTVDLDKPLPPSPIEPGRKQRKPSYLRAWLGRSPSSKLDPTYLQPQPYELYQTDYRDSTTTTNLSFNSYNSYHYEHSRSMPSSPFHHDQFPASAQPTAPRASSVTAQYPERIEYRSHTPPTQQQPSDTYLVSPLRSSSLNTQTDLMAPRARKFPTEYSLASPMMREGVSSRPRPHTWLSPTESFSDASQFSLFAQATTGLAEDADSFSLGGPPQLRGSLFARSSANDVIPLPLQNSQVTTTRQVRTDWQNFEPPPLNRHVAPGQAFISSRSASREPAADASHMAAINRELERLGIEDEEGSDDELPNYAQSQAEAHAKTRTEAYARARELEAQWRNTQGN